MVLSEEEYEQIEDKVRSELQGLSTTLNPRLKEKIHALHLSQEQELRLLQKIAEVPRQ